MARRLHVTVELGFMVPDGLDLPEGVIAVRERLQDALDKNRAYQLIRAHITYAELDDFPEDKS